MGKYTYIIKTGWRSCDDKDIKVNQFVFSKKKSAIAAAKMARQAVERFAYEEYERLLSKFGKDNVSHTIKYYGDKKLSIDFDTFVREHPELSKTFWSTLTEVKNFDDVEPEKFPNMLCGSTWIYSRLV